MLEEKVEKLWQARLETLQCSVLAGYGCCHRGIDQDDTVEAVVNELRERGVFDQIDMARIEAQVHAGYVLHFNDPDLTPEQVVECAFEFCLLLYSDGFEV